MSKTSPKLDTNAGEAFHPAAAFREITAFANPITERQTLSVGLANGRVLARDVATSIPLPPFDNSAVDGYGIAVSDIDRRPPVRLSVTSEIAAGAPPASALRASEAVRILTGAAIPPGVTAIVMDEKCERVGDRLTVNISVPSGANIRRRGEDIAEGSTIVEAGMLLDARHIAMLAASGTGTVELLRPVRVGVLSNGNELREAGEALIAGQIHDANRPMLKAMLASPWIEVIDLGRHRDDAEILSRVFAEGATRTDVIISSGGVAGSDADHIARAVGAAGGDVRRFRLSIKPGKPIVAGRIDRTAVLGLPGNPVSAMVDFLLFGRAMVAATAGLPVEYPAGQKAVSAKPFAHTAGRAEFVPARLVGLDRSGRPLVEMLEGGGAARLRPLILSDGLAEIPSDMADVDADSMITFHPLPGAFAS